MSIKVFRAQVVFWGVFGLVIAAPSMASDLHRYTGEAEAFDFGIEAASGTAILYLARKPTNEPLAGGAPRLVPDDEKLPSVEFAPTDEPGVYSARFEGAELPEGQLEAGVGGTREAVDVYLVEAAPHREAHHDHAHGTPRKSPLEMLRSTPVMATAAFGLFLFGLILGRLGRRRGRVTGSEGHALAPSLQEAQLAGEGGDSGRRTSAMIILTLSGGAVFGVGDARAGEGHSHDTVEISQGGGNGEVSIAKKSQFMINLRTTPASKVPVRETLETFGHLAPNPQADAAVRAPANGFVRLSSDRLLGTAVRKGQVIGRLEGVGTVDLLAPLTGTVVEVSAVSGTRVETGHQIVRIVDTSTLWIDAEVFQKDLHLVGNASRARIFLDGAASPLSGRVLGIKSAVDERTLTAKVFVEVDNPAGRLPLGAMAGVSFELPDTAGEGMVFPKGTVLNRGGEKIVFVQTGPETFAAKPVATRFRSEAGTVVVTRGLEEGDRVVVSGGYQLLVGAN